MLGGGKKFMCHSIAFPYPEGEYFDLPLFFGSLAAVDGVFSPLFTPLTYLTLQVSSKPLLWYPPSLELLHLDHALSTVPAQCVPGILFPLRGAVLGVPAWLEEMSVLLSATRWEVYGWK
jgi:hypothetical protein